MGTFIGLLHELQLWNTFSDQVLDITREFDTPHTLDKASAFRKQVQASVDGLSGDKYDDLLKALRITGAVAPNNMVSFLKAHLISPKRFGLFDKMDLTKQSTPDRIKHWTYQRDISEMQYQQSGIYPLIADAFDSLQSEKIHYNA